MSIQTILMIGAIIRFAVVPSLKNRVIPVKRLMISPAIFIYLFYQTVSNDLYIDIGAVLLGIITGITIGVLIRRRTPIKSDKEHSLIWLPGTFVSLITFSLLFFIHYLISYTKSVNPEWLTNASMGEYSVLYVLSCVSSITLGTNATLLCKYLLSKSTSLKLCQTT